MLKTFSSIIFPVSIKEFSENYYSKKTLYIKKDPEKNDIFFNWDMLDKMLDTCIKEDIESQISSRNGLNTSVNNELTRNQDEFQGEYSLRITDINNFSNEMAKLADLLTNELKTDIRINLYGAISEKKQPQIHFTAYDEIIIQAEGCTEWMISNPGKTLKKYKALKNMVNQSEHNRWDKWYGLSKGSELLFPEDNFKPDLEITADKGDVLYIPEGCFYQLKSGTESSIRISAGISHKKGIDFFQWLTEKLSSDLEKFYTVPKNIKSDDKDLKWNKFISNIKEIFYDKSANNILKDYYEEFLLGHETSNTFNFPYHYINDNINPSTEKFFSINTNQYIINTNNNFLSITINGQNVSLNMDYEPFIRYIFSVPSFTLRELFQKVPGVSFKSMLTVLNTFVRNNIVKISDKHHA